MDEVMQLARSIVNDTFPGVGGQQGRILTNDAPFTLPYFNNALKTLNRKLMNEGVTFPIRDNYIMAGVTALPAANPDIQIYIGYDGFFDGTIIHPTPFLPPDMQQPYELWEQNPGSGLPFAPMMQPEGGMPSVIQGPNLIMWEWRNYRIYMVGATQNKTLRLKYKAGIPTLNVPASAFATTKVGIIDCATSLANRIAVQYGASKGASPDAMQLAIAAAEDAEDDMAAAYIRRQQTIVYRRQAYKQGGSENSGGSTSTGGTGVLG